MIIVQLSAVGFRPAGRDIFRDLDWSIGDRDRTGLVGGNGAGKSSLLEMIAGRLEADDGEVSRSRKLTIGYLEQEVVFPQGALLLDAAMHLPPVLEALERELERIESMLSDPEVYGDEGRLARALERQENALERYERNGGPTHASRVKGLLSHMGFVESDHSLLCDALSGGQKKLVAIVALASSSPDLLLLDEPDNHLDLAAKQQLESFIRAYPGSVVIVSHDRYLLDSCVDEIAELDAGNFERYPGNYSAYVNERGLRRLHQQKQYHDQRREIARIEASIKRFELWASIVVSARHMKQARSRRKALDRMEASGELVDRVRVDRQIKLSISGSRGSRKALEISKLAAAFDDELVFDDVDLLIRHGERVGLVGENGCGKSVLFRMILEELEPLAGSIALGPSTRVGYYAQEHETLEAWLDRSPLDMVRDISPMQEGAAVSLLMRLLFRYEQLRQPIRNFSGGERSRLQLARIMLQKPNLLLLDEPTNNLDIASVEVLESVLEDFEGAVLVISHDRYFLDTVVDRIAAFENGTLTSHIGGYTDYVDAAEEDL